MTLDLYCSDIYFFPNCLIFDLKNYFSGYLDILCVQKAMFFAQIFMVKPLHRDLILFLFSGWFNYFKGIIYVRSITPNYVNWLIVLIHECPNSGQKMSGILDTKIPTFCNSGPVWPNLILFWPNNPWNSIQSRKRKGGGRWSKLSLAWAKG